MQWGKENRIDPAMAWPESQHTLGRPRNCSQLRLAPDSRTGLEVFALPDTLQIWFSADWTPLVPGMTTCRSAFPGELRPFGIRTREEKGAVGRAKEGRLRRAPYVDTQVEGTDLKEERGGRIEETLKEKKKKRKREKEQKKCFCN